MTSVDDILKPKPGRTKNGCRSCGRTFYADIRAEWCPTCKMMLGDFLPIEALRKLPIPHHGCGVYFLWSADDELLYVGRSITVDNRVSDMERARDSHPFTTYHNKVPFKRATALRCERTEYRETESRYIQAYRPPFNTLDYPAHGR